MTGRANQPRDLVWSLEKFQSPDNAMKFFDTFQNRFMVYSLAVQKLYCEYVTHLTGPAGNRRMVVLPDFKQYEAIFNRVDEYAVEETSIHIYPLVKNGETRLVMSGQASGSGKLERLPLSQGLRSLKIGFFDQKVITPILMIGDLREFPEKRLPYLKLHTVNTKLLSSLSEFEQKDIAKGAWEKLEQLC